VTKFFLALALGLSALTASAGTAGAAASPPAPSCSFDRLPDDPDGRSNADGVARYMAWSQTPANQKVLDSVHRALDTVFGSPEAGAGLGQLRDGLIGLVVDHRQERFVVVLSRHLRLSEYEERITRLVPETRVRGAAPVVVQHGCLASTALARTMRVLDRGNVVSDRFGAMVDPSTSRVRVSLPGGHSAVPRALTQLPAVTIDRGDPRARKGRRSADRSPHWGAASIRRGNGVTCTSWANVKRGGRKMGATAGHCGKNGTRWKSGRHYYGEARGRKNFPEQDSMRLHGRNGHKWHAKIHVNGGRTRIVTGANNPRVGDLVCKSGQTTGVVCSIEVLATHAVARYAGGVNHNLIYAERRGVLVGQGGDSGGPVFKAKPDRRAGMRGMEVAGSRFDNMYAEKARVIQRHLGVKVLRRS
jgi:hypothetical protein